VNVKAGQNLAEVVCRSLGYAGGEEINMNGESSGFSIVVDSSGPDQSTGCAGTEDHLGDCTSLKFGTHDCDHTEDVGVKCTTDECLTDFCSKETMEGVGWVFDWDDQYVFSPGSPFCKNVFSTSYCGFRFPGDGMLSYTFSDSGTATLEYGQSWDEGSVQIKINDKDIDSRTTRGSSTATFNVSSGDVLKIIEFGDSVINIDKLTLETRESTTTTTTTPATTTKPPTTTTRRKKDDYYDDY
jgi:hypothetical protein